MPKRQSEKPLFRHAQAVKIARLLDMLYKPVELAEELGVSTDTVRRSYIPAGCPVTKDNTGHVWIHGTSFATWAKGLIRQRTKKSRPKLAENRAYCLLCKCLVDFENPTARPINAVLELLQAPCPKCGKTVNKIQGYRK